MSKKDTLPKRTVANAFIIWRVPENMAITREMLLANIETDIESSAELCGFSYTHYARRESPARSLKFLLQRSLLSEKNGLITRNDRTKRYMARLPEGVVHLIDQLPVSDPLTLLAGAGDAE